MIVRDAPPTCTWEPAHTQDPGFCSALITTTYTALTMYGTAPPATTAITANSNVACTYHEQSLSEDEDEPYCVCSSGQSTVTAPLFSIASPTIQTQNCEYTTWPGATTSISTDLAPATTNTNACMVCTPYAVNEDNCNTIANCVPQYAVATVTVGSAPVHVGALTGTALYTAVSEALETLCPSVTQTTSATQCTATGHEAISGVEYVDVDNSLNSGALIINVPTSSYNITSLRDAMIASISLSIQTSATGSNCFNVSYGVEQFKPRDGMLGWSDQMLKVPRNLLGLESHDALIPRDHPFQTEQHMIMCNAAYFHTANYYDPWWRTAPQPGPTDFMNAVFTFQASNSDNFLCEFLDMLVDGLTMLAPEFVVQDVEVEEGIDALCCLEDGGCQLN